jgi:hypothetical protein
VTQAAARPAAAPHAIAASAGAALVEHAVPVYLGMMRARDPSWAGPCPARAEDPCPGSRSLQQAGLVLAGGCRLTGEMRAPWCSALDAR